MRAAGVDAARAQCGNGGGDDARILVAHAAFLAGVGIERSNGQARIGNAEIALQRRRDHQGAPLDQRGCDQRGHRCQRDMDSQRHGAQAGAGEHHHTVRRSETAGLGDKFGLAGMGKAHCGEPGLGNRPRHQPRSLARSRQCGGLPERIVGQLRAFAVGLARTPGTIGWAQDRQAMRESGMGLPGIGNRHHRHAPPGGLEYAVPTGNEERRKAGFIARGPGPGDHFGPDPGRIAQRDGERLPRVSYSRSPRRGAGRADTSAPAC